MGPWGVHSKVAEMMPLTTPARWSSPGLALRGAVGAGKRELWAPPWSPQVNASATKWGP